MYNHSILRQPKIALYSHDTQGLGHIRRNLAVASALISSGITSNILLISGTQMASSLDMPLGVDCLILPGIAKHSSGRYGARSLKISLNRLIRLRAQTIRAALLEFAPDVMIVDKVPYGVFDELQPALKALQETAQTRFVLGLRDVLDAPPKTRLEWGESRGDQAVRELYDSVWIYGDPAVFDCVEEYRFGAHMAEKSCYTGYLNRLQPLTAATAPRPTDRRRRTAELALCAVGGGQDGFGIAQAFANADLPPDMRGLILTGPFMPQRQRRHLQEVANARPNLTLLEFTPEPEKVLQQADHVIAMGGYNATCELLATRKRALIIPRVRPRLEQWIRAQRLKSLGVLDVLHPDALTPGRVAKWLACPRRCNADPHQLIDLNGLSRIPHLVEDLLCLQRKTERSAPRLT